MDFGITSNKILIIKNNEGSFSYLLKITFNSAIKLRIIGVFKNLLQVNGYVTNISDADKLKV